MSVYEPEPAPDVDEPEPDFATRVDKLVAMQSENPEVGMRMLAEMYIFVSDFERSARTMAMNGGPMAMLKAMMGKG